MSEPLPSSVEELAGLVIELRSANAGLREVIAAQAAALHGADAVEMLQAQLAAQALQLAAQEAQLVGQAAELAGLKQRLGKDSSTSNRPPSADPPYRKPQRRSSRRSSGRDPGKQKGASGSAMPLVEDPNETIICDPDSCADCGTDLSGAPVTGTARRQVLPGYTGTIVRDGYAGYIHLIDAHHAWCGAHLLRPESASSVMS